MADKRYVVLEGQRYTGKHRVYYGKGEMGRVKSDDFPESELFGNAENKRMAMEGAKNKMGKFKDGTEFVSIKGKEPKIKALVSPSKKGSKK